MFVRKLVLLRALRRFLGVSAVLAAGCGVAIVPPETGGSVASLNLSSFGVDDDFVYVESAPNDLFDAAEYVGQPTGSRVIRGIIETLRDVDVYDLGPVMIGDRVLVAMTAADSLYGAIGLFDASGAALLINDHRNVYLGRTDPFVDVVVRHESPACYVAVSATPGFESVGEYVLTTSREFSVEAPAERPDVVLLSFDGAEAIRIGARLPVDVPPFDAANITASYAGATELMAEEIVARVREDYAAYNVEILSTSEGDRYEPPMTRIFFGMYDTALLGLAEGIDEFNATDSQQAIVFTDTFRAMTRLRPSVTQMAQAIANVASHETGHLLGMVHTTDRNGIMDVTASLSELLQDQVFTRSPIYSAAFPVGYQDAVQYLLDAVGGDIDLAYAPRRQVQRRGYTLPGEDQTPARLRMSLSTCALGKF